MTLTSWVSDSGTTLALDGSDGVKVLRGVRGLDGPPRRNTVDQRVGDGATRVGRRRPERSFQLPIMVDESVISVDEVNRLFDCDSAGLSRVLDGSCVRSNMRTGWKGSGRLTLVASLVWHTASIRFSCQRWIRGGMGRSSR